jgi:hypothetical protein
MVLSQENKIMEDASFSMSDDSIMERAKVAPPS